MNNVIRVTVFQNDKMVSFKSYITMPLKNNPMIFWLLGVKYEEIYIQN